MTSFRAWSRGCPTASACSWMQLTRWVEQSGVQWRRQPAALPDSAVEDISGLQLWPSLEQLAWRSAATNCHYRRHHTSTIASAWPQHNATLCSVRWFSISQPRYDIYGTNIYMLLNTYSLSSKTNKILRDFILTILTTESGNQTTMLNQAEINSRVTVTHVLFNSIKMRVMTVLQLVAGFVTLRVCR